MLDDFFTKILTEVPADDAAAIGEQMLLYALTFAIKPKTVVEIGTHRGQTALFMAAALHDIGKGKLITCDPKEWGARGNFAKFPELLPYIDFREVGSQDLVVDEPIDLLFLDGMHEYEWVEMELKKFLPKLSEYGVIVFHDCAGDGNEVGVNQAILDAGLQTAWIPTRHCLRIYGHLKNPPKFKHAITDKYGPQN